MDKAIGKKFAEHFGLDEKEVMQFFAEQKETITITFGDVAENHVGMEKLGDLSANGFATRDLIKVKEFFKDAECEMVNLNEYLPIKISDEANILIVRNGINFLLSGKKKSSKELFDELVSFEWDTKAKMYGRVVNKHARHNVCFGDKDQEPDYENGKGRIISWKRVPLLSIVKNELEKLLNETFQGEGNRYYDISKCGIGWHGDAERRKVLALRVGAPMNICFNWFYQGKPIGAKYTGIINDGDIYLMNWKASGFDWKQKKIYTLRHSAGCEKYTNL